MQVRKGEGAGKSSTGRRRGGHAQGGNAGLWVPRGPELPRASKGAVAPSRRLCVLKRVQARSRDKEKIARGNKGGGWRVRCAADRGRGPPGQGQGAWVEGREVRCQGVGLERRTFGGWGVSMNGPARIPARTVHSDPGRRSPRRTCPSRPQLPRSAVVLPRRAARMDARYDDQPTAT
jgi:hypothetical protein